MEHSQVEHSQVDQILVVLIPIHRMIVQVSSGVITYLKHNYKPSINFISTEELSISIKNLKKTYL